MQQRHRGEAPWPTPEQRSNTTRDVRRRLGTGAAKRSKGKRTRSHVKSARPPRRYDHGTETRKVPLAQAPDQRAEGVSAHSLLSEGIELTARARSRTPPARQTVLLRFVHVLEVRTSVKSGDIHGYAVLSKSPDSLLPGFLLLRRIPPPTVGWTRRADERPAPRSIHD